MKSSGLTLEVPDPGLPEEVLAKLARADAYIEQAGSDFESWLMANTNALRREREPDGSEQSVYLDRYIPLPPDLPLVIGDALFNLRCALDHIIYRLHEIQLGTGFTDQSQRRSMFVISRDERGWNSSKKRVAELDAPIQALVDGLQPHHKNNPQPGDPTYPGPGTDIGRLNVHHWLGVLEDLHVIDKHRRLHVVTSGAITFGENPNEPPPGGIRIVDGDGTLHDGALIGTLVRADPQHGQAEEWVPVRFRFAVYIADAQTQYQIPGDLAHISNAVKAALALFVPHL